MATQHSIDHVVRFAHLHLNHSMNTIPRCEVDSDTLGPPPHEGRKHEVSASEVSTTMRLASAQGLARVSEVRTP
eukprot:11215117-Alexandrium_andersonii.AAC.1